MMNRSVVLLLVSAILALGGISAARAEHTHRVFTAQSVWHKSGNFDEIDTDAISFDATESAYKKCRDAGFDLCVLKNVLQSNVETKSDGLRYVEYTAVVAAVDGLTSLRAGKIFKNTGKVSSSQPLQTLTNLGAKSAALGSALGACYQAGYSVCAIVALDYQSVNDTSLNDGRYTTVAGASVKGLSLVGDVLSPSSVMEESEESDLLPRIDLNLL
jgi:hypothetical protein